MRVVSLDYVRGLLLAIMAIDHFGGNIAALTSQTFGFVSAAEGFIFVSGLTIGIAYNPKKISQGEIETKIIKRSFLVYRYHFLSVLFAVPLYAYYPDYIASIVTLFDVFSFNIIAKIILLLYQPNYLDILPLYVIFLFFYWLLIRLLGRCLELKDIFIFLSLYFLSFAISLDEILKHIFSLNVQLGFFDIFSWQILFFTGVILGSKRIINGVSRYFLFFSLITIVLFFLLRHGILFDKGFIYDYAMVRSWLNPIRLLNFFLMSYFVYALLKSKFIMVLISPFGVLGRNSIQVFTFHLFLFMYFAPLLLNLHQSYLHSICTLFLLLLMFVFCLILEHFRRIRSM